MNYLYGSFVILGFVLIFFAIKQYRKTIELLNSGVKTSAKVVNMITVSDSDGSTYKPVFEYYDHTKTKQTFTSEVSSSPPAYKIGEKVQIIYNPGDSDEVKTMSYWGLYRWTIILLSIASPLLIIGGGYFLFSGI